MYLGGEGSPSDSERRSRLEDQMETGQPEVPAEPVEQVTSAERVQHMSDQDRLRKHYASEPKVSCYIPTDSRLAQTAEFQGPDGEKWCVVRIGPLQFHVPVGLAFEAPKTVVEIINESLERQKAADRRVAELSARARGPVIGNM